MIKHVRLPLSWYQACSHFAANPPHEIFLDTHGDTKIEQNSLTVFISVDLYPDLKIIRDWLDYHSYDFTMFGCFEIETFPYRPPETRLIGMNFTFTNNRDFQLFKLHWDWIEPSYRC